MGYLERWDIWLIVILIILILVCVWCGWGDKIRDSTRSCTRTDTGTRVEAVPTEEDDMPPTTTIVIYEPEIEQQIVKSVKQSAGERRCQEVVEEFYNDKFRVQVRDLDELQNPKTRRNLELDIYHPSKKLAIEYDGRQHYEVVPRFHSNGESDLKAQQERDALKDKLCKKAGIHLIRVSYKTKLKDIEKYILDRLPDNEDTRRAFDRRARQIGWQ
jgi:very-short-patch-repair endonuclease